jgi:hypothetical protein
MVMKKAIARAGAIVKGKVLDNTETKSKLLVIGGAEHEIARTGELL